MLSGHWLADVRLAPAGTLVPSVPVVMLIVPPVEIDIKCHDTARGHARDQSPEEQQKKHKKSDMKCQCQETYYKLCET